MTKKIFKEYFICIANNFTTWLKPSNYFVTLVCMQVVLCRYVNSFRKLYAAAFQKEKKLCLVDFVHNLPFFRSIYCLKKCILSSLERSFESINDTIITEPFSKFYKNYNFSIKDHPKYSLCLSSNGYLYSFSIHFKITKISNSILFQTSI